MLFKLDEFRRVGRSFDGTNRFADAFGLHDHQLWGKVWFVLCEVIGNLFQFRNDRLRVRAVAEQNLHQFRCPLLAVPWILTASVLNTGADAFFDFMFGQESKPLHANGVCKHLSTRGRFNNRLIDGG